MKSMNEHGLDAMLYAWRVMKEKEENKMEGIFLGKVDQTAFDPRCISLSFGTKHLDQHVEVRKELDYDCDYMLVKANDVIVNNDELLKLRDEAKELKIQIEMLEAANTGWAKNFLAITKNRDYFEEKADSVEKKYDELVAEHTKLQAELMEIKTTRTLREAYIAGVEKGCESLREERDRWKSRWNSVVTDIGESLKANGITFVLKEIHGDGNWDLVIDIPELDRVKAENDKLRGMITTNFRDLESQVKATTFANDTLDSFSSALTNDYNSLKAEKESLYNQNQTLGFELSKQRSATDYWRNTYYEIVEKIHDAGVSVDYVGCDSDNNCALLHITNHNNQKWQAMLDALEEKGVEVIYMGEEDGKPIVDVKVPEIDILKKELEALKSRTLDNVEIRLSCGDIVWTYCDGFVHVSSGISGMISADEISTAHINCLCKNHVAVDEPEPECKDCKYHVDGSWRVCKDGEALAECRSPKTKYGFCHNNCNGKKACDFFEKKE